MKTSGKVTAFLVVTTFGAGLIGTLLPKTHEVSRRATYQKPPAEVWKVLAEFTEYPSWRPEVKKVERVPAALGLTGWREITRFGASTIRVLQSEEPKRLVATIDKTDMPYVSTWTCDLTGEGGGTTVTITERGQSYNPFARFISKIFMRNRASLDRLLIELGHKLGEEVQPS